MTHTPENPPAFPYRTADAAGMTLRDWFAGQAMSGFMALPEGYCAKIAKADFAEHFAEISYRLADAMLAERAKQAPKP